MKNITEQADNFLTNSSVSFTGSAQEDTTVQRIIKRDKQVGMYPERYPYLVTYAKPISDAAITRFHQSQWRVQNLLNIGKVYL
ncbi:MAG: hypothetical protein U5J95_03620 [Balneolaceae bacterium]|nr:hypothetical protein [Balneolaceae bacterium]